jgi:hypothetical protein
MLGQFRTAMIATLLLPACVPFRWEPSDGFVSALVTVLD